MPSPSTRNWWLFPPQTREVQFDEKWGFFYQKEKSCDPTDPQDRFRGDEWDHTAIDPESRLLRTLVPGKRDGTACRQVVQEVHDRTGGRTDVLLTSDEHASYEPAFREVYGIEQLRPRRPGPGPGPGRLPKPVKVLPPDLCYATVRKRREKGRVVEVMRTLIFGTWAWLLVLLGRSTVSTTINTSFVERHNGTDRHQNSRKGGKKIGVSRHRFSRHRFSHMAVFSPLWLPKNRPPAGPGNLLAQLLRPIPTWQSFPSWGGSVLGDSDSVLI